MTAARDPRERRRRALTALVFLVAAVTLVESWFACVAAAEAGGRPLPWLWPTTLEAFAVALILVAWDSLSDGRPARLVRLLLLLTTSVMVAVQVLDAPPTALGWLTAGWTPLGLNLMVEVAVRLRYDAERRAAETEKPGPPEVKDEAARERAPVVADPPTESLTPVEAESDRGDRGAAAPVPPVGVVTLTDADVQALRRVKSDPAKVTNLIERRGLDRGAVDHQLAAWAGRNGGRKREAVR